MSLVKSVDVDYNYQKLKIRLKLWENDFVEKQLRRPNKNDIKTANPVIREAYKKYWKLKAEVLQKTLINISGTSVPEISLESNSVIKKNFLHTNDVEENKLNLSKVQNSIDVYDLKYSCHNNSNKQNQTLVSSVLTKKLDADNSSINDDASISKSSFQLSQKLFDTSLKRNLKNSVEKCNSYNEENIVDSASNVNDDFQLKCNFIQDSCNYYKLTYPEKKSPNLKNTFQQVIDNDLEIDVEKVNQNSLNLQNHILTNSFTEINCEDFILNSYSTKSKKKRVWNHKKEIHDENVQPNKKICLDFNAYIKDYNQHLDESRSCITCHDQSTLPFINIESKGIKKIESERSQIFKMHQTKCDSETFENDLCDQNDIKKNYFNIDKYRENDKTRHIDGQSFHNNKCTERKNNFLNNNFIKINLKKKSFVRGSKSFNFSKYKKKQYLLLKKKSKLSENDLKQNESLNETNKIQFNKNDLHIKNKPEEHNINNLFSNSLHNDKFCFSKLQEFDKIYLNKPKEQKYLQTQYSNESIFNQIQPKKAEYGKSNAFEKKRELIEDNFEPYIRKVDSIYKLDADGSIKDTPLEVLLALKKFGHKEFRDGQEKAIMRILSGQSTLLTLATGSGKSLCYQIPAYIYSKKKTCITLVISPLVSLMDDQLSEIPHFLSAACIHTNQSFKLRQSIFNNLRNGKLNILLISPETIVAEDTSSNLGTLFREIPPIAFACIDEVHCISHWSHSFRPSYLMVCKVLREKLGVNTFLGLTATASMSTIKDIVSSLNIKDTMQGVISHKSLPSNLILTVSKDERKEEALLRLLESERFSKKDSIIVYCTRRVDCSKLATFLRASLHNYDSNFNDNVKKSGIKISSIAEAYHAGLSASKRTAVHKSFMESKTRIVVATVAFGMGINKSNTRSVIHYNMPANLEHYVQEIGRAGRDGLAAHCHLFLHPKDNLDKYELQRHINGKSIDRYTIKRLLKKIFIPCNCSKLTESNANSRCLGHEIMFPVSEMVRTLDISEEMITTLLYYLELHPKNFINVLPSTHMIAKISSDDGFRGFEIAAKKSPALAVAITLSKKNKIYNDSNSILEFSLSDIAQAIGWNIEKLKNHLKNLEKTFDICETKKARISVNLHTLGFRVTAPGDLNEDELDEAFESLYELNLSHLSLCHRQLDFFSILCHKFSFNSINECLVLDNKIYLQSESFKNSIRKYFENDNILHEIPLSSENIPCLVEKRVVENVHNIVCNYQDINFTGRTVANIFHGIQTPNHPAFKWSKTRFWRAHIDVNFNILCQIANREIVGA